MQELLRWFGCPTTTWILFHGKGLFWAAFVHLEAGCMQCPCKLKPLCLWSKFGVSGSCSSTSGQLPLPHPIDFIGFPGAVVWPDTMKTAQILWYAFILELLGWDTQSTATKVLCAAVSDLEERLPWNLEEGLPPSVCSRVSWLCF